MHVQISGACVCSVQTVDKRLAITYFQTWNMYKAMNRTEQAASALVLLHNHDSL